MELVLIVTFAGLIGALVRYLTPGRDRHGLLLLPALQISAASVVWTASVWVGLAPTSIWPWLTSLGLSTAGIIWFALWLPTQRDAEDEKLLSELSPR
jgi:hypothetical protein